MNNLPYNFSHCHNIKSRACVINFCFKTIRIQPLPEFPETSAFFRKGCFFFCKMLFINPHHNKTPLSFVKTEIY